MSVTTRINSIVDNIKNAYTSLENKSATIPENKNIENLANAIDSIEIGQVVQDIEWKDVVFIDFDGTPLYSYTMEEVQELTELPPLPTRKGFTYQGWNWTLEDIKVQADGAIVGAHCVTSDGLTRLYLEVDKETRSFILGISQNKADGFLIDWGDGTSELSGSSTSTTTSINKKHTYEKAGKYIITLIPQVTDVELHFAGTTTVGGHVIKNPNNSASWITNGGWSNILKKIEASEHLKKINTYGFFCCRGLETINIPKEITMSSTSFRECSSLESVVVPSGTTTIGTYGLYYNSRLKTISLPSTFKGYGNYTYTYCGALKHVRNTNTLNTLGSYCFRDCYNLERYYINEGTTNIPSYAFNNCNNLKYVKIPSTVRQIGSNAFYNCYSLKELIFEGDITRIDGNAFYRCMSVKLYDFRNCSSVPTLSATSAFTSSSNIGNPKIVVPDDLYDEWIVATNWSTYASYIVKESEYND